MVSEKRFFGRIRHRLRTRRRLKITREGRYFRLVQPFQHHTNVPDKFIYTYSFALQPQDIQQALEYAAWLTQEEVHVP